MEKAIGILQNLKPGESFYKQKLSILAEIINEPEIGIICPKILVEWCKESGLKVENNCEDKTSWWTVSGI